MDLDTIKKRISETMAAVAQEQTELDGILKLLASLNDDSFKQMSRSASESLRKRKKDRGGGNTKTHEEMIQQYEAMRVAKEQAIGRMWEKLHDLQNQQQELDLYGK